MIQCCVDFISFVDAIGFLGAGTFGEVWTVQINDRPRVFVAKIYKNIDSKEHCIDIQNEVNVLLLGCPKFPKLIYSGYNLGQSWCIVTDYIEGGPLKKYVDEQHKDIPLHSKKTIAFQIAEGLTFLHEKFYTHG